MSQDIVDLISDNDSDLSQPPPVPRSPPSSTSALKIRSVFADDDEDDLGTTPAPSSARPPPGPSTAPAFGSSSDEESDEELRAFRRSLATGGTTAASVPTPRRPRKSAYPSARAPALTHAVPVCTGVSARVEKDEDGCVVAEVENGDDVDERFLDVEMEKDSLSGRMNMGLEEHGETGSGEVGIVSAARLRELVRLNSMSSDASEEQETPAEMNVLLLKHQRQALAWMGKREEEKQTPGHPRGGILADDQGFGKTLSMIALFLTNRPARQEGLAPAWGNLVVTPTSIMQQWAAELEGKIDDVYRPRVLIYHGMHRPKDPYELVKYDVVLTSYATLVQEYPKILERDRKRQAVQRRKRGPLFMLKWFRVVLDEAQAIKNFRAQSFLACAALKTDRRWLMSGTPIQNTIDDIYAQFVFLRYFVVDSYKQWKRQYKIPLESSRNMHRKEALFKRFQAVLGVVLLRRAKSDKIDGKPVISLPPMQTETKELRFSKTELAYYQAQEFRAVRDLNRFGLDLGFTNALVILLRLRQCCGHPALCNWGGEREFKFSDDELDYVEERMLTRCMFNALPIPVQERLAIELGPGTEVAQTCPICLDVIDSEGVVTKCGHIFCMSDFEVWHKENDTCPSCRTTLGGDEDKMSLSEVRKEVHAKIRRKKREEADAAEPAQKKNVKHEPARRAITLRFGGKRESEIGAEVVVHPRSEPGQASMPWNAFDNQESELAEEEPAPKRLRVVDLGKLPPVRELPEDSSDETGSLIVPNDEEDGTNEKKSSTSAKIKAFMADYEQVLDATEDKVLCFSQWTRMLDLVEVRLNEEGYEYVRLDGSMTPDQRSAVIRMFNNRSQCRLFLISLKAGATGLNLTAANRVFLMDSWWNPAVEQQAIDRVHRIGQNKDVKVIRYKIENSVEDKILQLQEKKRAIVDGALGVEGLKTVGRQRLTMQDILGLFSDVAENVAARAGNANDSETANMARDLLSLSRNEYRT